MKFEALDQPPQKKHKVASDVGIPLSPVSSKSVSRPSPASSVGGFRDEDHRKELAYLTTYDGRKLVRKGSVNEKLLVEEWEKVKSRKKEGKMTEQDKREERRASNRLSAYRSRERRKIIIEDLQQTVNQISKDNIRQRKEKAAIQVKFDAVCKENELLKSQLTAVTRSGSTWPMAPHGMPSSNPAFLFGITQNLQQPVSNLSSNLSESQLLSELFAATRNGKRMHEANGPVDNTSKQHP